MTSSCPCVCLTNPKRAHGNLFSLEKWMVHFSISGWKIPAWLEPLAHIACLTSVVLGDVRIVLCLLRREPPTDLRGALLLQGDQRNLTAERNKKQILRLLKFSAESGEEKSNDSSGFTYYPTFRDKITHSFPVGRAEMIIRGSDMIWAITHHSLAVSGW